MSAAEQRVEAVLLGEEHDEAPPLDVHAEGHDEDQRIRGDFLSRKLVEPPDEGRGFWRRHGRRRPVVRIERAVVTGKLVLQAADLPYLLEFVECRFEQQPDLRQAALAGLVLQRCWLPGLAAQNLTAANDVAITACAVPGPILLLDAQFGGSLALDDSHLTNRGGRVLDADRLSVSGALLAQRVRGTGQIRVPGARIRGNLNLAGAVLGHVGRTALNAIGANIGGTLRCTSGSPDGAAHITGKVLLLNALVQGDVLMRGVSIEPAREADEPGRSEHADPVAALVADRSELRGNVYLDEGLRARGTVRAVNARIGGDLLLANSSLDVGHLRSRELLRALHLDGTTIAGELRAHGLRARGQLRITDLGVGSSIRMDGAVLTGPGNDVLRASRTRVNSDVTFRDAQISGSVQLQGVTIGASLDLRACALLEPAWREDREVYKPGLDLADATIGRDLACSGRERAFRAEGQVRLRRTSVGRGVNLRGCVLGALTDRHSLNAFGLSCQELSLLPAEPPPRPVTLRKADCELFGDNEQLWRAVGGVELDDFRYQNFSAGVADVDRATVSERIERLRTASAGAYHPGPYDQLAAVFRDNGTEEHAVAVLIAKQRDRYRSTAAHSRLVLRPSVRLWSLLQRVTVNYGYRPARAALWLVLFAVGGTWWFADHPLQPLDEQEHPVWNPFLYTVDQLVPIVNFGNDETWQVGGASQWITAVLIAAGWVLATTVAAGTSRALRRDDDQRSKSRKS